MFTLLAYMYPRLRNLEDENLGGRRFLVGNVMIDTLVANLERARRSTVTQRLGLSPGQYMVATFHRPSNVDERESLDRLLSLFRSVGERTPLVLPLHPRTRASIEAHGLSDTLESIEGLRLCEPLGYLDFIGLVSSARAVITDSGGIQEETTYLRIPCLTMRANTERPVTVDVGSNLLIGDDHERLHAELDDILQDRFDRGSIPELWDGAAAPRIVEILARELAG